MGVIIIMHTSELIGWQIELYRSIISISNGILLGTWPKFKNLILGK